MTARAPMSTPSLGGWAIAAAAGVVAAILTFLLLGYGRNGSVLVGVVVFVIVALVAALPRFASPAPGAGANESVARPVISPKPANPPKPATPPKSAVSSKAADPTPAPSAPPPVAPVAEIRQPQGLAGPRDGKADDLKRIKGVGPKLEAQLNRLGFFHFDQIAAWGASEIAWVDDNLEGFKGRVTRDDWVAQARILAAGDETEFSRRVH